MRRYLPILIALLALAGCGSGHHHSAPNVARASCPGGYVTQYGCQAHSPTFGLPPKSLAPPPQATTGTLEMADSVTASAYPLGLPAGAGYTSGFFVTYPFVHAHYRYSVSIAVNAGQLRDNFGRPIRCLDVEPGDASPSQAGPWDREILAIGGRPCDYENASTLPAVKQSIAAAGLTGRVDLFVADWTFHPFLYPGSAATQWTDHGPQGQNYDESTVTPAFLGISPLPLCFTHHEAAKTCAQVKAKIASDQRAAASSLRAWDKLGDGVLFQRMQWFAAHVNKPPKSKHAYRARALASTQRAYKKRGGYVLMQRYWFFLGQVDKLRLAN